MKKIMVGLMGLFALIACAGIQGAELPDLPKPDGKPANMAKPVQVFIIMGQSNTLEMGHVGPATREGSLEKAVKSEDLYPFLVDDQGNWITRMDVRNVSVMQKRGNMNVYRNDWLGIKGRKIGIEIGIGNVLGSATTMPIMVLKSSIGNRSLGWDLLPPGSKQYEYNGKIYAGYKESPSSWEKGTEPKKIGWYAGKQYDDDVGNAKKILADLDKYYPGAKGYQVAGFFWWQGDKDMRNPAHADMYEKNLVQLIKSLRKDFNAPNAPFVCASLGQTKESDTTSGHGKIMQAMKNVASGKYAAELGKKIGFVYTHPLSMGSSSSAHYSGNAKTYMNVGLAMGEKMVEILTQK